MEVKETQVTIIRNKSRNFFDNEGIYALLEKDIKECNLVFQNLKVEIQEPTLVEEKKNDCANEEVQSVEKRQAKEHHPRIIIENVLVGIDKYNFPINRVTVGMEEEQQMPSRGTLSIATSQAWIDVKHEELTLLVGKVRVKFNLNQSIQLTNEVKMACKRIESLVLYLEE